MNNKIWPALLAAAIIPMTAQATSQPAEQPETIKTAFCANLDELLKKAWATLNFSTLSVRNISDACLGYQATGNLDFLELAKRGFSAEIERLSQRVITEKFPAGEKDCAPLAEMIAVFAALQQAGALSWMEQESAYTTLRLAAARFDALPLPRAKRQALKAAAGRININFPGALNSAAPPPGDYQLCDGDRVVFFGDSLASGYGPAPRAMDIYPRELEKLHCLAYPERKVLFINLARGGESIAGGIRRSREISLFQPTVVIVNYGANGLLDKKFGADYPRLFKAVKKNAPGARIFMLSLFYVDDHLPLSQGGHYTLKIAEQKQALLEQALRRVKAGPVLIDVLGPMRAVSAAGKSTHPDFTLCEPLDGVHPYETGALLVAYRVFLGLHGKLPGF